MIAKPQATHVAAILAVLVWSTAARSELNTVTCSLQRAATEFQGSCDVPCLVNALAVDIDGPNPKVACNTPPRRVSAALRQIGENWLGTMEGKHPEYPTRFEIVKGRTGKTGVAKTPFGWFALQTARLEDATLTLTIAANRQLPPTTDDIRIIQRAMALAPHPDGIEDQGRGDEGAGFTEAPADGLVRRVATCPFDRCVPQLGTIDRAARGQRRIPVLTGGR